MAMSEAARWRVKIEREARSKVRQGCSTWRLPKIPLPVRRSFLQRSW
jgi:hypothetical protein